MLVLPILVVGLLPRNVQKKCSGAGPMNQVPKKKLALVVLGVGLLSKTGTPHSCKKACKTWALVKPREQMPGPLNTIHSLPSWKCNTMHWSAGTLIARHDGTRCEICT
eukprot:gnl/MRDRNA2_/MRDRNA2_321052_c0_seq1.p1 gnl/MRDRNA2_/MRDRNA2_321052_c0~~gnl/MRDRNA2_/MRDRNA2_321052_c0_seq1.p1  ORF type:complete len:108 (+),score=11.04 gnl/MRDRNA2_/MRDRNA2_321052_c0_seq1:12-335(+)